MIEIRPKTDLISTEGLMMYFAECLQKFCKDKQGAVACKNCLFNKKHGCCLSNPEEWKLGEEE